MGDPTSESKQDSAPAKGGDTAGRLASIRSRAAFRKIYPNLLTNRKMMEEDIDYLLKMLQTITEEKCK